MAGVAPDGAGELTFSIPSSRLTGLDLVPAISLRRDDGGVPLSSAAGAEILISGVLKREVALREVALRCSSRLKEAFNGHGVVERLRFSLPGSF
jgi:hypothetical protein